MKKLLLGVFIFLVGATYAQDKLLSFSNGYVNSGKFKVTKSVTEGDSYIDVTYNFTGAYMYNQVENGKTYTRIAMPEARVLDIKGEPALPYYNDLLAITSSEDVSVSIVESSYNEYSVQTVIPASGPIMGGMTPVKASESEVYSSNSLFPSTITNIDEINSFRSIPFVSVSVYPVRFNPVTKKVRCYSSVTYRLKYKDGEISQSQKSSDESLDPFKEVISNPQILDKFKQKTTSSLRSGNSESFDYLIVTTNSFTNAANKIKDWKTLLGFSCKILSNNGNWKNSDDVKNAIRAEYAQYHPTYLLIIGDFEHVPGRLEVTDHTSHWGKDAIYSFYSDNAYARFNDIGYVEDVFKGRISAKNGSEASMIVDKIINYEKNPTTSASFYNNVCLSAYFQDEQEWDDDGNLVRDYDGKEDWPFFTTSENIKSQLQNIGYNVDRVYTRTSTSPKDPTYNFNWNALPSEFTNKNYAIWKGKPDDITAAINKGSVLAVYNGHGEPNSWYNIGFNKYHAQKLENGNKLPVFLGYCCQSGTYSEDECFTEAVIRNPNGGGVGAMGFSHYGITPPQDQMCEKAFSDLYNKNVDRRIGRVIWNSLFANTYDNCCKEHMHKVTHYFGDPSMEVWTDVPTCFSPTITKEGANIRVKTGGVNDCKVTICRISDMTILSTTTMSGSEGLFNVGNDPCYVTITKHNYIPYVGVARDLYLQNISLSGDKKIHGVNITAGKNVTSELTQGNVYVKSGNITLLATTSLKLKSGFIVERGAKFSAKKQARPCNYSGNGPSPLRSADIDLEYDDEEFEINPEITDLDDAISDADKINIYPNPTDGLLYINVSNSIINDIVVTDISGQVYINETVNTNQLEIDFSSYPKGIYLVNIVTENDSYTKKIVLK